MKCIFGYNAPVGSFQRDDLNYQYVYVHYIVNMSSNNLAVFYVNDVKVYSGDQNLKLLDI